METGIIRPLSPRTGIFGPRRIMSPVPVPKPDLIGAGLENLGNTCFLNAVVQCLIHTVPLLEKLMSSDHKANCAGSDEKFCSIRALQDLIDVCLRSSGRTVHPNVFVENLNNISSSFVRYQQEDAHEFLNCLLDRLDNGCQKPDTNVNSSSSQESSFIKQIFGGCLRSQVQCCACGHRSDTFEPLIDLSLEIEDVDSLNDALESFTKVEKIDDPETRFKCEGCEAQVSVEKQLMLEEVPTVIAFHLKRFKINGCYYVKIDKHIDYPLELDLTTFLSTSQDGVELKYDLYAVVVHGGWTSSSGHYYCFIRSSPDAWHEMDDSMVNRVSEECVQRQQAYILFYIKKGSSPWFSSLMEKLRINMYQNVEDRTSPSSVLADLGTYPGLSSDGEKTSKEGGEMAMCMDDDSTDLLSNDVVGDDAPSLTEQSHPCSSDTHANQAIKATCAQPPTPRPKSSSPNERVLDNSILKETVLDMFSNERLEDEKEDYHILPGPGEVPKPAIKVKECGRMNETIKRQMRNMPSSRRQALMAHMSPSLLSGSPELDGRKRRSPVDSSLHGNKSKSPTPLKMKTGKPHSSCQELAAEANSILYRFTAEAEKEDR